MSNRRIACLTMDIEADYHDLVPERHYQALDDESVWEWLADFSQNHGVPWTAFVVGELLETRPALTERLAESGWEIELHSYSHDPDHTDTLDEIRRGKDAFAAAFGREPIGYRAPLGKITPQGLRNLPSEGFCYDASVFPTWRPGAFNHLKEPMVPHLVELEGTDGGDTSLVEIPFAAIPRLRVVVSVSYMKLLGLRFYRWALSRFGLPEIAVIDCHFHDLAPAPDAYRQLPPVWKFVYRRNQRQGREILAWLVGWLKSTGYEFMKLEEVSALVREEGGSVRTSF